MTCYKIHTLSHLMIPWRWLIGMSMPILVTQVILKLPSRHQIQPQIQSQIQPQIMPLPCKQAVCLFTSQEMHQNLLTKVIAITVSLFFKKCLSSYWQATTQSAGEMIMLAKDQCSAPYAGASIGNNRKRVGIMIKAPTSHQHGQAAYSRITTKQLRSHQEL